ncbi:tyrosine-type recombinase/integrase [Azospirillum sp. A23]|uniref:tyrosine-type recombinase/integrase n=1 Tax=Azospirillum sp. A23 TaxID=3160608 RepID=UPI0036F26A3F
MSGALHESARIVRDGRDFTLQIRRSRTDQQSAGTDVPVKRVARAAGLDPAAYAAHSLRSGFLTTGGRDGIPLDLLMQLSGHKSHRIAARYFQTGAVHQNPAADLL